jgi:hypothetical protein
VWRDGSDQKIAPVTPCPSPLLLTKGRNHGAMFRLRCRKPANRRTMWRRALQMYINSHTLHTLRSQSNCIFSFTKISVRRRHDHGILSSSRNPHARILCRVYMRPISYTEMENTTAHESGSSSSRNSPTTATCCAWSTNPRPLTT